MKQPNKRASASRQKRPKDVSRWSAQDWEDAQREYLEEIWRLPIEERQERAIARQSVQRRVAGMPKPETTIAMKNINAGFRN